MSEEFPNEINFTVDSKLLQKLGEMTTHIRSIVPVKLSVNIVRSFKKHIEGYKNDR